MSDLARGMVWIVILKDLMRRWSLVMLSATSSSALDLLFFNYIPSILVLFVDHTTLRLLPDGYCCSKDVIHGVRKLLTSF